VLIAAGKCHLFGLCQGHSRIIGFKLRQKSMTLSLFFLVKNNKERKDKGKKNKREEFFFGRR